MSGLEEPFDGLVVAKLHLLLSFENLLAHPLLSFLFIVEQGVLAGKALAEEPLARFVIPANSAKSLGDVTVVLQQFADEEYYPTCLAAVVVPSHQVALGYNATVTGPESAQHRKITLVHVHLDSTLVLACFSGGPEFHIFQLRLIYVDQPRHVVVLIAEEAGQSGGPSFPQAGHLTLDSRVEHLILDNVSEPAILQLSHVT